MRALVDASEIRDAFDKLYMAVGRGDARFTVIVGYQGGSENADVAWHGKHNLWVLLDSERLDNRYWCAFGLGSPRATGSLSITCEVNPPKSGIDERCAGIFALDDSGALYLGHNGKIGGGRTGVGKSAFLGHLGPDALEPIEFPDGSTQGYIIVGRVDGPGFLEELREFVAKVAGFKERVRR